MDLEDFILQSVSFGSFPQNSAGNLVEALENFVLYVRQDGTLGTTSGVAIIPPDLTANEVPTSSIAGEGWRQLVATTLDFIRGDVSAPVLDSVTPNAQGFIAVVSDDLLSRVSVIEGFQTPDGRLLQLTEERADPIPGTEEWQIDTWDREAVHVTAAAGSAPFPIPLEFTRLARSNGVDVAVLTAQITILEKGESKFQEGVLTIALLEDGTVDDYEIRTFLRDEGREVQGKTIEELHSGDQLKVYTQVYSPGAQDDPRFIQFGETLVFQQSPEFTVRTVQAPAGFELAFGILGRDLAKNVTLSPIQVLP